MKLSEYDDRSIDWLIANKVKNWDVWINDENELMVYQNGRNFPLPHFSTNMADAWTVIEEFETAEVKKLMDDFYSCELTEIQPSFRFRRGEAKTAPKSICLAALRMKGLDLEMHEDGL